MIVKDYNSEFLESKIHIHLNTLKQLVKDLYGVLYMFKMNHYIIHIPISLIVALYLHHKFNYMVSMKITKFFCKLKILDFSF